MLTVHVVRHGGHGYYLTDLGRGRTDDGRVAGELPGEWSGGGSTDLGLAGRVTPPEFGEVLEGRHPGTGEPLRRRAGDRPVAGFDLTFCAPKSVSILHLLAPAEVTAHVGAGHQVAVADAAGYLDRAAVGVRRRRGGEVALLPSTGSVAGGFVHRTSRALDPHLHTHLVVANVAQGVDGRWSSVDSRRVFAHLPAAQGVYHARLRLELAERLGVAWDVRPSGLGDVVGVPPGLRRIFSQRTSAMDEYEHSRFGSTRQAGHRRGSFHATRPDKDATHTVEELEHEWRDRAAEVGYHLGDLTTVVGRAGRVGPGASGAIDPERARSGIERLASARATVARRDLVAVLARASAAGATGGELEATAARLTEATGRPVGRGARAGRTEVHGLEPRWSAQVVARSFDETASVVGKVTQRGLAAGEGIDRGPTREGHGRAEGRGPILTGRGRHPDPLERGR